MFPCRLGKKWQISARWHQRVLLRQARLQAPSGGDRRSPGEELCTDKRALRSSANSYLGVELVSLLRIHFHLGIPSSAVAQQ